MIDAGTAAPDFTLPDQDGNDVSLSDLKGKAVVLFFYPKADTPGCTTQACSVRDHSDAYAAHDAVVLGVSPDPVARVKAFHDKHEMNFTLLADADHAVAEQYGAWVEKSRDENTYWGVQRSTFVIDANGSIAAVLPKVSPKTHDAEVLKVLGGLTGAPA